VPGISDNQNRSRGHLSKSFVLGKVGSNS
jgi:hypothetical protein